MIDQNSSRGYGYLSGTADSYNIPRRTLDLSDYLDIVRRHLHWVLAPAFLGLVLAVMVAFAWPDTYVSEATMRILPPQVPSNLLPTGLSSQLLDRISSIQQQVLSRDGLIEIIRTHNLYPDDVKKKPMEDIVEQMRSRIGFERVGVARSSRQETSIAFRIRYFYNDKYTAQKVVRDIVDKCIRLTNQGQFDRASSTTQFLGDQLSDAKRDLDRIEDELTKFRMANQGRLPDQVDNNVTQLRVFQSNLDSLTERINRFGQEKIYLESQLAMIKDQASKQQRNPEASMKSRVKSERLVQSERELMQMRAGLSALLERYTESHPDVKRIQGQIEVMERLREQALAEEQAQLDAPVEEKPAAVATNRMSPEAERSIGEIESRLGLIDMSIQRDSKRQAQLQDQISSFASRIESRPMVEQEYVTLTRDYSLAKSRYDDLAQKRSVSEMMTDLENRKQSELLEMLDQPSLPQNPTDPNRLMIIAIGLAAGVFAGVLLVGVREIKDGSLKNLKDVRLYSNMAVLGSIPLLENDLVVRRKRRLMFLAWTTALLGGIAAMSGSMYYYYYIARR